MKLLLTFLSSFYCYRNDLSWKEKLAARGFVSDVTVKRKQEALQVKDILKKLIGDSLPLLIVIDICPLRVVFIEHLSHFQLLQNSKSTWPECTKLDVIEIDHLQLVL